MKFVLSDRMHDYLGGRRHGGNELQFGSLLCWSAKKVLFIKGTQIHRGTTHI